MAIPSLTTQLIHADADGSLFFGSDTGIYLLHVNTPVESINYPWLVAYLEKKQLKNAHGFCVFGWQKENNIGKLRYFVPWYGRIEDHVTGSIHQYLTPLVAELFAVKEQSWTQLSALGGRITTRSENTRVLLSGQCRLANT
jgi:predicted PhzF superfamily epimerase YddE/YHI9